MKKTIGSILVAVVMLLSLAACGGGELDHQKVAESILNTAELNKAELVQVNPAIVENYYPGLPALSEAYTIYVNGPGGMVEEVAVITAKDGSSANDIKTLVDNRLERQHSAFVDYVPAELPKLDNAVVKVQGNTVVVLISGDANAKTVVDNAIKGK